MQPIPNQYQPVRNSQYGQPSPQMGNQYGQPPPQMNSPLPGGNYSIRLPWGCSESCKYYCEGYCEYEFASCDSEFTSASPMGLITQSHFITAAGRDPFNAHLIVNQQELALSRRQFRYL